MPTDDRKHTKHIKIEGGPGKAYKLFRVGLNNEPIELVAEADTREELDKLHKRRLDWRYQIQHKRKPID